MTEKLYEENCCNPAVMRENIVYFTRVEGMTPGDARDRAYEMCLNEQSQQRSMREKTIEKKSPKRSKSGNN